MPEADHQSDAVPAARRGEAQRALDELRHVIEVAAAHPEMSKPLALSRTVTRFHTIENPSLSLTVMLDREPVEVMNGSSRDAESEIMIGANDLLAFAHGQLQLPIAIAKGRASYTGCVRKFLRAAPILKHAARIAAADAQPPPEPAQ